MHNLVIMIMTKKKYIIHAPKIMDYENTIYYITMNQDFHPSCLFKDKHSNELNFPTLFYGQLR
jgi:hypothetical protein